MVSSNLQWFQLGGRLRALRTGTKMLAAAVLLCAAAGCYDRQTGQVEFFGIEPKGQTLYRFNTPLETPTAPDRPADKVVAGPYDPIRLNRDVISLQVLSVHLESLPLTVTGSHDVVVFAEAWENAVESQAVPLTGVVYTARNQQIPGVLNFTGGLGYGPTKFKGHPLKLKFTIMVLQKKKAQEERSAVDIIANLSSTAAPQYGAIIAGAAGLVKDILRAQPDVISFDYELTLTSDHPEGLVARVPTGGGQESGTATKPVVKSVDAGGTPDVNDDPDTLYRRRPWLRYGQYALVETKVPASRLIFVPASRNDIVSDASKVHFAGSELKEGEGNQAVPVAANYLVFSISPEQLAEDDAVLQNAARDALATLQKLRTSETDLTSAVKAVTDDSAALINVAVRGRLDSLADQAARQAAKANPKPKGDETDDAKKQRKQQESDLFDKLFDASAHKLEQGLADVPKQIATSSAAEIKAYYHGLYGTASPAASPASKPSDAPADDGGTVTNNAGTPAAPAAPPAGAGVVTPGGPGAGPTTRP